MSKWPDLPDPEGPVAPVDGFGPWIELLTKIGTTATFGGVFLVMMGATMYPLAGATRTARLRWQERQKEIETAIAQAAAKVPPAESTPPPPAEAR